MDLSDYIPQNDDWIQEEAERMGWDELTGYYNRVFQMLFNMKRGERFEISREVHPQNYSLFIKCVATAIRELSSLGIYAWAIEKQATVIVRDEIFIFKPKKADLPKTCVL